MIKVTLPHVLNGNLAKNSFLLLAIFIGLTASLASQANPIDIQIKAPHFTYELANNLAPIHEVKLSPNEYNLSVQLKPLLQKKSYQQVIKLLEANPNTKKSTALLLMTGQVYLALKQPKLAEKILKQVLLATPKLVRAHRSLAALYLQSKQFKNAQHHLTKSIEYGVQDAQFFGQLAYINLKQEQPWSAIAGYQQALLLQPKSMQWQQGLLFALQQAGNHQSALNMVDELLNQHPKDKRLWLQRAQITLALADESKALTSMEMALRYGEEETANLLNTAQLHLSTGSMTRAGDLLINLAAKDPQNFSQIEPVISWLISDGEIEQAARILKNIRNIKQLSSMEQSLYFATLGSTLQSNQPKQAIKHFKKSLTLNPNQASVLIKLAEYYQSKQQFSHAQLYYQRAQVFPKQAKQSLAGLAQLALDQRQYSQALTYLKKLKLLSDNKQNIEKNIVIIQRLITQKS